MYCSKCGNEMNEGEGFCPKCGNLFKQNNKKVIYTKIILAIVGFIMVDIAKTVHLKK